MTSTTTSSTAGDDLPADSYIRTVDSLTYWNSISPDVNGMLGGYPQISRIDLQGSKNFVNKLCRLQPRRSSPRTISKTNVPDKSQQQQQEQQPPPAKKLKLGVDCGAGIGRITEGMLTSVCEVVDVVEPVEKFACVLENGHLKKEGKVGDVYISGLESWQPSKKYDLIWNQWCVGHLTDEQLVTYLTRAGQALSVDGWMIVKENLSMRDFGEDIFDKLDSSVTRSDITFKKLFKEAGLEIVRMEVQTGFPKSLGLYPVKMYALRPK